MSRKKQSKNLGQLTLFVEGRHAKIYRWLETALAWLERSPVSGTSSIELLRSFIRDGLSSKMSPDFIPAGRVTRQVRWESVPQKDGQWTWKKRVISQPSWVPYKNSGMGTPTQLSTANTTAWRNGATVYSLSQILLGNAVTVPVADWIARRIAALQ